MKFFFKQKKTQHKHAISITDRMSSCIFYFLPKNLVPSFTQHFQIVCQTFLHQRKPQPCPGFSKWCSAIFIYKDFYHLYIFASQGLLYVYCGHTYVFKLKITSGTLDFKMALLFSKCKISLHFRIHNSDGLFLVIKGTLSN